MIETEGLTPLAGSWGSVRRVEPLHGDGSSRRFFRIHGDGATLVLLVGPDAKENAAYVRVARHLAARGVRVPQIHAVDEGRGWILLEDLGDRNLWGALQECRAEEEVVELYRPVLELLVQMQVAGAEGFDLSIGFASAPYGRETMVEAEGFYFVREFAEGVLGLGSPTGLSADLERMAEEGSAATATYLLHRDFQSRNIQIKSGVPYLIDFQGARPGPLGYDAAALILDPYAGHPRVVRERLLAEYLRLLRQRGVDTGEVAESWRALGAFRLLQALGAYGKLGARLGKTGFLEHAGKALDLLYEHLGAEGEARWPALFDLIGQATESWRERSDGSTRLTPPGDSSTKVPGGHPHV